MKSTLLLPLLLLSSWFAHAQEIKPVSEIFKIMEASRIGYQLDINDEKKYPQPERVRLFNTTYTISDAEGRVEIFSFQPSAEVDSLFNRAETLFGEKRFAQARDLYQQIYELDSTFTKVLPYIAQTYGIQGDLRRAKEYYSLAITKNPTDYFAHWMLADIFRMSGQPDEVLRQLVFAHLFNRNHLGIQEDLRKTLEARKIILPEWQFEPEMEMAQTGAQEVQIVASTAWLPYAIARAVWTYEPGYKEAYQATDSDFSLLGAAEALGALLDANEKNKKFLKTPMMKALQASLDEKMLVGFIMYEMLLPEYPLTSKQLSTKQFYAAAEYLLQVRCTGKTISFESLLPE